MIDNPDSMKVLDPGGMYEKIYNFPEQILQAWEIGKRIEVQPKEFLNIDSVIVAGMGGSAIGGALVRSYLARDLKVPFLVCRNYNLPEFVNKSSLVIISSYSGNTEETIAAFRDALSRKARIVCLSTGGIIGEMAEEQGILRIDLPRGYQPRAALAFSFVPLLMLISKLKLVPKTDYDFTGLAGGLKKYRRQYDLKIPDDANPSKMLARKIHGRIPIIYTGPDLTESIGLRWKGQICENAKTPAFCNQFPEFNHNELVGWEKADFIKDRLVVLYLKDSEDSRPIARRMAIVEGIIKGKGVEVINIYSQGDYPLGRLFSLVQLGDFTSFYLAILNKVDPTPVEVIESLKKKLAEPQK
jgi:glucose/mannose-6-phosphate isomerase